jgi:hypothetical protein
MQLARAPVHARLRRHISQDASHRIICVYKLHPFYLPINQIVINLISLRPLPPCTSSLVILDCGHGRTYPYLASRNPYKCCSSNPPSPSQGTSRGRICDKFGPCGASSAAAQTAACLRHCYIVSAWDSGCGPSPSTGTASADLDGLTIKLLLEPAINCVAATTAGAEVPLDSPEEEGVDAGASLE